MTGRFVLSPRAQTDLDDIWNYTADRWGLDQAETYTRNLWQRIKDVAARPAMGQECSEIREGYQKFSCGSHILFYVSVCLWPHGKRAESGQMMRHLQ
jgi:toxin ParE1/3/4